MYPFPFLESFQENLILNQQIIGSISTLNIRGKIDQRKHGEIGSKEHFSILQLARLTILVDDKISKAVYVENVNAEHIMKCNGGPILLAFFMLKRAWINEK